jgi:hypothetical protein
MRIVLPIAAIAVVACLGCAGAAWAADAEQICQAAKLHANAANADVGVWLDRQTRHDGVDVVCNIRTVQFRRFFNVRTPAKDWHAQKSAEWSSANCAHQVWRTAIDDGWMIVAAFTTAAGEHADVIATCK